MKTRSIALFTGALLSSLAMNTIAATPHVQASTATSSLLPPRCECLAKKKPCIGLAWCDAPPFSIPKPDPCPPGNFCLPVEENPIAGRYRTRGPGSGIA